MWCIPESLIAGLVHIVQLGAIVGQQRFVPAAAGILQEELVLLSFPAKALDAIDLVVGKQMA
jgi:hypothetical protein